LCRTALAIDDYIVLCHARSVALNGVQLI